MVMMTRVNISVVNNFAAGPLDGYTILLHNRPQTCVVTCKVSHQIKSVTDSNFPPNLSSAVLQPPHQFHVPPYCAVLATRNYLVLIYLVYTLALNLGPTKSDMRIFTKNTQHLLHTVTPHIVQFGLTIWSAAENLRQG